MENSSALSDETLLKSIEYITGEGNRLFAVIEGAHFDNIQLELENLKLEYHPLYLGEGDRQNQIAGPHLVVINNRAQISQIMELGEGKPCIVWWGWPDEGDETTDNIFKHLRSINMVEIPIDRYDAEPEEDPENEDQSEGQEIEKPEYEPVLFRHADPNVVASLLPILNTAQLGRLFGRSTGLTMHASDFGEGDEGLRSMPRPESLPKPHAGFLRITHEQYGALGKLQSQRLRKRAIKDFSMKYDRSADEISSQILNAFDRAEQYNLTDKDVIWSFIDLDIKLGMRFEDTTKFFDLREELQSRTSSEHIRMYRVLSEVEDILNEKM